MKPQRTKVDTESDLESDDASNSARIFRESRPEDEVFKQSYVMAQVLEI